MINKIVLTCIPVGKKQNRIIPIIPCHGEGGVQVKNHCVGLRPAPPLAEAKVTQLATASFRDHIESDR